jgi:hypothetical protein
MLTEEDKRWLIEAIDYLRSNCPAFAKDDLAPVQPDKHVALVKELTRYFYRCQKDGYDPQTSVEMAISAYGINRVVH